MAAILFLFLAFLVLGARAYAADVAFIQGEMVAIAGWLEANVPPDALIAVHDTTLGPALGAHPRQLLSIGVVDPRVRFAPIVRSLENERALHGGARMPGGFEQLETGAGLPAGVELLPVHCGGVRGPAQRDSWGVGRVFMSRARARAGPCP